MKKMITALASIATGILFGAANGAELTTATGTSFEALTQRPVTVGDIVKADDTGDTEGVRYWYSTAGETEELGAITNDVASGLSRPDMFLNETQSKSLFIETSNDHPLVRTALTNTGASSVTGVDIGEGIYLDTLVKFTAADDEFKSDLEVGDKIAIEYVEREAEYTNGVDQVTGEPTNLVAVAAMTNFVVRAGLIGQELGQANYYAYVSGDPEFTNFNKDAWHRLTVRTIADVGDGHVGFVIYLDGDMNKTLEYSTSVDAGFGTLNAVAQTFYNENKHALFPSAVEALATGGSTISSVAFSGNGFIDDVSFTAKKPTFIQEASVVTVTWDAHVATLTLNGESVDDFEPGTAGSATVEPNNGAVLVSVTFAPGYEAGKFTTDGEGSWDSETSSFIDLASGETCNIVSMLPLYEVNGVAFDDLDAALEAAAAGTEQAPATLKLLADCDEALIFSTGVIILDLAGCDVQGGVSDDYSIANVGATLIVTNSGTEAAVKIPLSTNPISLYQDNNGFTTITAGTFEGAVSVYFEDPATAANYLCITGGKFLDTDYATYGTFYLAECVPAGISTTYISEETMVQVGVAAPQPIGTYSVTVTPNANADYAAVYNDGGAAVEFVNDVAAVTVGKTITITATPKSGYEYAEQPTGWTLSEGVITIEVSAEATVAIPAPTAVLIGTYSVTVIPTNNTTYAAVYNDGGAAVEFVNHVAAVTVGKTITITVTPDSNYEYASAPDGWTLSEGVITKEISAAATVEIPGPTAAGGSYPSYIPEDAAVKAKYDAWAQTYGADTGSAYETAFLLNIAPAAADQTLEPASITMEGGKVVISANQTLTAVNGKVYVKVATTLAGLATAEWTEATLDEGKVQVTPGSSDTAGFYKIKVDF